MASASVRFLQRQVQGELATLLDSREYRQRRSKLWYPRVDGRAGQAVLRAASPDIAQRLRYTHDVLVNAETGRRNVQVGIGYMAIANSGELKGVIRAEFEVGRGTLGDKLAEQLAAGIPSADPKDYEELLTILRAGH